MDVADRKASSASGASGAARVSRRGLLRHALRGVAGPAIAGAYAWQFEPYWTEFHDVPIAVPGLPARFEGARVTQLTDLHVVDERSAAYVRGVVREVNRQAPDLVFVTGDLVTRGRERLGLACGALSGLRAPTFVSLGNHDYERSTEPGGRRIDVAEELGRRLGEFGYRVLRNEAVSLGAGAGERVWVVGLEDLSSGRFSAGQALSGVDLSDPTLVLSHNPDTAATLDRFGVTWVFAGHTHGGQIRLPWVGAAMVPIQNRQWQRGAFELPHSRLYVSRGVGYLAQLRLACRPEVPTFVLRAAPKPR